MTDRSQLYKNTGRTVDKMKRRRFSKQVELRKINREEILQKYRNILAPGTVYKDGEEPICNLVANFETIKQNSELLYETIRKVAEAVSEKIPTINSLRQSGIITILVQCLTCDSHPNIQYETVCALTNIASGTSAQTNAVVEAGAVPQLIRLLGSMYSMICEQSAWALGNIICDSPHLRDYAISLGVITPLLNSINKDISICGLRTIAWVILGICRNSTPQLSEPSIDAELLRALRHLITYNDHDVLIHTLWALQNLSGSGNDKIEMIVEADFIRCLLPLLSHDGVKINKTALIIIVNISSGTNDQSQCILDHNALSCFSQLLQNPLNDIKNKVLRILSNIAAGTQGQIQTVINHGFVLLIVQYLYTWDIKSQKEAAWTITNLVTNGSREQVSHVIGIGIISPFCQILSLKDRDSEMIQLVLEGLSKMVEAAGEEYEIVYKLIKDCGGLDMIEQLQYHSDDQTYEIVENFLENYFCPGEFSEMDSFLYVDSDNGNFSQQNMNTTISF